MILFMSRDALHAVTLPILIDAGERAPHGYGAFPDGTLFCALRQIKPEEIKQRLKSIFRTKGDLDRFIGLVRLRRAFEGRDDGELRAATERIRPWISTIPSAKLEEEWTGGKEWQRGRWDYAQVMSGALQKGRLVMWWTEDGQRLASPALYCPDLKTAAFVMTFLGGLRICPKCEQPFIPPSDNIFYCTPAHGVAHRTARSRRNKKREVEQASK